MAIIADAQGVPVCTHCGDVADHFPGRGYRCPNCTLCGGCDRSTNGGCDCVRFGWIDGEVQTEVATAQEWCIAETVIDALGLRRAFEFEMYEAELDQMVFMAVRKGLRA